jgi:DNA-binding response OmpR family regulator
MVERPPVVAVINTSPDVVDMLRLALEHAGHVVVSAFTHEIREGVVDVGQFVRQHDPSVVLYDIAPPYDSNWQFFLHVRAMESMQGRAFILTTTNVRHVGKLAGKDETLLEIVGKPYDLDRIVKATDEALRNARGPSA